MFRGYAAAWDMRKQIFILYALLRFLCIQYRFVNKHTYGRFAFYARRRTFAYHLNAVFVDEHCVRSVYIHFWDFIGICRPVIYHVIFRRGFYFLRIFISQAI